MSSDAHEEDGVEVGARDVPQQRIAVKKAQGGAGEAPKPARTRTKVKAQSAAACEAAPLERATSAAAAVCPVDLIDRAFALADDCGGMASHERLVDGLAGI